VQKKNILKIKKKIVGVMTKKRIFKKLGTLKEHSDESEQGISQAITE